MHRLQTNSMYRWPLGFLQQAASPLSVWGKLAALTASNHTEKVNPCNLMSKENNSGIQSPLPSLLHISSALIAGSHGQNALGSTSTAAKLVIVSSFAKQWMDFASIEMTDTNWINADLRAGTNRGCESN